jgi:DNA-directed RNA polymerase subunit RPC12/RpoP
MSGYMLMSYVLCSGCGDPVGGRIPSGNEPRVLTCTHCGTQNPFRDGDLPTGLVCYDEETNRWRLSTLADSLPA